MTKITNQMVSNRQKKKRLILSAFVMTLFMALFTQGAMAQSTTVYMKDGSKTIQRGDGAITFYDSHGPSQQTNYWETWYNHNENFTYVFKPAVTGDKIKVTFNAFKAYAEPASGSVGVDIGNWVLRLNDDYLYIYEGNGAVEANLIAELTGNTQQVFSVMTDGPITFKFVSNARYREEGWFATVELVQGNMAAQAPLIQRSTCSDQVEIIPTTQNARIIYSIGDNDPAPGDPLAPPTYEYTAPISFPEETIPSSGFKVNAMSQLASGGTWSSVTHAVFQESDRVPFPDASNTLAHTTITREDGTNTIVMTPAGRPAGLNDTYVVRYTMSTNGTEPADPTLNNSTLYEGPITASVNGTIFRAKTFAVSCSNQCSATSVRYVVDGIYAPTPVIDLDAMTITAVDEAGTTFEILYTLDGTMPASGNPDDPDNEPIGNYSATQVSLIGLTPGQTIRAMAYRSNGDEFHTANSLYIPSEIVSAIYIPSGGSGVYNDEIVLLDDREDHNWSYYSDEDSPIKSLNPADIKITYYGNSVQGRTTMTTASENGNTPTTFSASATGVKVNYNENGNQFIYLKTLEKDETSGNYPYTMISNPFQVRPTLTSGGSTRTFVLTLSNADSYNNWSGYGTTPATVTVSFSDGSASQVYNGPTSSFGTPVSYNITKSVGTTVTVTFNPGNQSYPTDCQVAIAYQDGTNILSTTSGTSTTSTLAQFTIAAGSGNDATKYRGFYAWRIKSLSEGLTISGKSVGETINADEEIVFETTKDYGNEVEFEALWAQAYVTTGSTNMTTYVPATVTNSYERNFHVVTSANQTASNYQKSYPVTISSRYPDGTSGGGSLTGAFTAAADTKIENITINSATSSTWNANGKNFAIGRGVSGTVNRLYGLNSNQTSSFNIRLESGSYNYLFYLGVHHSFTSGVLTAILGSDYDRANKQNGRLSVNSDVEFGYSSNQNANRTTIGSSNAIGAEVFHLTVKSGDFDFGGYGDDAFYISDPYYTNMYGKRTLIIEGGIFPDIAGGYEANTNSTIGDHIMVDIRVKGGTINGAFYGAARMSAAGGHRRFVFTGGTMKGWIAGGCNGTQTTGGKLYGDSYIYFGGNAKCDSNGSTTTIGQGQATGGNIFGAGSGNSSATETATVGEVNHSTIVIADNAMVEHSVYGGGNYGYVASGEGNGSDIYVFGGTVKESVFGGSNMQKGQIVNITMKDGTIQGSIYGGSNSRGTISGLASINVSGGTVTNIYGGGYGANTTMSTNGTKITVTDGTINNNIYGGGEQGIVEGAAIVSFEGGSVNDIYGAGKGTEVETPGSAASANVARGTTVNVKGGVVDGSVYGGGEFGTVAFASGNGTSTYNSTVSISGGEVKGDVFGGGKDGTTQGKTTVNVLGTWDGTVIRGNVFAGAYGEHDKIYVAGLKTLNISGGRIYGSIYGGSRNANDGNTLNATGGTDATSITNISGGRIDQHVYAAGYYGSTKGSVYAFIGLNAINEAPNSPHSASGATPYAFDKTSILIAGSVWAGGDWGVFTGTFGAPTITGNSNIYINGEGYSTDGNDQSATNYMNIKTSILGCGTSCDAGAGERTLILSHYGADVPNSGTDSAENPFSSASRQVNTIQRFHNVIFDDAKLGFVGQGKINSLNATEKYALYEIDENVYLANGSTMVMNVPSSQIYSFHSVTCPNAYATSPAFTAVNYDGLGETGGETDNKIRVNGGSYIEIKYVPETTSGSGSGGDEPSGEDETLTYDFEDGEQGWTYFDNDGDNYSWGRVNVNDHSSYQVHGGEYLFISSYNSSASSDNWLISPQFRLGGSISFYVARLRNSSYDDYYRVYVSTTGTSISDFTELTTQAIEPGYTYALDEYDLSNYSGNGYVAIRHISNTADQAYIFIDDVTITQPAVEPEEPQDPEEPTFTYTAAYGELEGFAHMMAGNPDEDATCAYARPKQSTETGNILPADSSAFFNLSDGGWVSYTDDDNEYDAGGGMANPGPGVQLRYENHYPDMRNNSEYYRIWRKGGDHHTIEAVANVHANGITGAYNTVEIEVELPSWGAAGSYFRFDRTDNVGDNNTLIDYGSDVMTFNGANYTNPLGASTWMYWQDNATTPQVTGVGADNATVAAAIGQNGILSNPNLNFGLVIEPGKTMKSTDVNYIINSEADVWLASVEKPFNCDDNTHKPTIKLVLTYSDELSANATLDPVLIKLVQCDAQGNITDYVTIKLIINTSMNLTSGFKTQIYARMDGSANTREISMVPVVLPTFNVAVSGENAKFYLQKVDFIQNGGVALEHDNVICAEARESTSSSGTALNIDRFAMTIAALPNPDNSDDWRNITGAQDAVQQPNSGYGTLVWGGSNNRGVHLGDGKGRNPLSLGITMYYNSNEEAPGKSKMGDMVFTIEVRNIEGGTGTNYTSTFTITVEVYRLGPGDNFYVDGINGQDLDDADRAKFPDKAAKTVNFIFNRLNYMPGDNIIVVNELPISRVITWDGSKFQNNVKIYRYPGGHKLTSGVTSTNDNANEPYLGPLVNVTNTLNMKGVIMDGMYAEATAPIDGVHNPKLYPTGDAGDCTFDGIAEAPLITISNGARVNMTDSKLQNNYNSKTEKANAGGAIHVTYEGILAMNSANRITGNYNENGGGVYVDGAMIVSDYAYVFDNYTKAVSGSKVDPEQNNVMLEDVTEGTFRVVQVGTSDANDAFDELLKTGDDGETKIGVTKDDWVHGYDGYMPIVYAEPGSLTYLNDPYNTQSMVVHDGGKYRLERYVSSEYSDSPNFLYWLETWVTAVTSQPDGFKADSIDTPAELAWAISIVNGENGCTPAPNTNFTLTDDIDMSEHIWVPIGNETTLYNGTFEGNGHLVTGLNGSITRTDMGMFGRTNTAANIQNMMVNTEFNTNSDNLGTVVGTMTGGTLSNVEGAGDNTSRNTAGNNGGLVGVNGGTIHSSFAVTTIKGGRNMGGLVAVNNSNLFNSYSAAEISDGMTMGGLVATNNGRVENCYNATNAAAAFAVNNNGIIRYCYTAEADENETITYVKFPGDESTLEKHGTYDAVKGIKELGYMYGDNKVTAAEDETIGYVKTTHEYVDNHTVVWDGLLSVLNQWVADGNVQGKPAGLSTWNRPLTQALNGDLPVLAFPKDNCLGNLAAEDGKMLRYSAFDANNNGLDHLLNDENIYKGKAANVYLYNSATGVVSGTGNNNLFIHEDAALLQAEAATGDKAMETIKATVGVTFDNSCKSADDYFGNTLAYDWHLMSTPLSDAPLGITYNESVDQNWWEDQDSGQVTGVSNSYMPDNINGQSEVKWDFYTYYEPEYHWINFKRNSASHNHYESPHDPIDYTNETTLVPGKGYMMAISQDSYMSNNGTLNNGEVKIPLTVTQDPNDDPAPTKDWGSNLVGNPYQAYLDISKIGYPCYVYDADQGVYGPYMTGASVNDAIASQYIHPHQAFFVVAATENPDFKFTYDMATTNKNEASFFRGEEQPRYPLVNLFVENERGNRDLAVVEFNRPELNGVRKVNNLRNANFKVSAYLDKQNYGLVFVPEGTERVPVHFKTTEDGTFTLTWHTLHGTFTSLILVDNLTGTRTDMLRHDHYTFNGSVDDYAARFYITYNVTDVEEINGDGEQFAWFDGNDWIVNGKGQLEVIDMTGRVLYSQRVNGEQVRLQLDGYAAGVYMLRMSGNKNVKAQKIVVK